MTQHARTQIRDELVERLTSLTTTGAHVYPSRVYPSGADALPGLCVYAHLDTRYGNDPIGPQRHRELTLVVEARSKPEDGVDLDENVDLICAEVEAAIMADPRLGNMVKGMDLQSTELTETGDLERPAGTARMTWTCRYDIAASDPTTLIYAT